MVLYIDIDGTLIMTSERHLQSGAYETGLGCFEFLRYATQNFDCRWLTFHALLLLDGRSFGEKLTSDITALSTSPYL